MSKVSTGKIIKNDYAAFLLTIGGPISLAISGFAAVFSFIPGGRGQAGQAVDPQFARGMCVVAALLTVLLFALLAKRISRLKRIIGTGPRATATVREIGFFKDRGRVEFEYVHDGQQYQTRTAVMENKQTKALVSGSEIEVAMDPMNPEKALIVQLYCTT